MVIGSGQLVDESNVAYIHGTKFDENGIAIPRVDVYRGGIDEIQSKFNSKGISLISGGKNAVKNWSSSNEIEVISPLGNKFNWTEE